MMLTKQDKQDLVQMVVGLGLFVSALFMISVCLSFALEIKLEHARHLVSSVVAVILLGYIFRDLLTVYWKILIGVFSVILLVGFYGLSTAIYIEHFTTLGLGDLPVAYSWIYFFITFSVACATAVRVKIDFFR